MSRIGTENLRLASQLGMEKRDLQALGRVIEILNIRDPMEALGRQDEAELVMTYLKTKYRHQAALAERDYKVARGQARDAEREGWTSPRGKVDEGLADYVENDIHDLRTNRERTDALKDLMWGMRDTIFARRRSLEERNITLRKESI